MAADKKNLVAIDSLTIADLQKLLDSKRAEQLPDLLEEYEDMEVKMRKKVAEIRSIDPEWTVEKMKVLKCLDDKKEHRTADICESTGLDKGVVKATVDELQNAGKVKRIGEGVSTKYSLAD